MGRFSRGFHRKRALTWLALAALLLPASPSRGQNREQNEMRDTLEKATILANQSDTRKHNTTQTGLIRLDSKFLKSSAAVFGAPDIIKSLQLLPGVAAGNELMSGMYVHGGDGTDNLFLLDGVPIYNISHFGGIFSNFNTDVVNSLDFYKSGFPARYGGRASSVVDVSTKEGDQQRFHGSISLGIADGRVQLEGPIVKGKTSFNFGYRRSWLDLITDIGLLIANRHSDNTIDAYSFMQDLNAGITHNFSGRSKLRANLYWGNDKLKAGLTSGESVSLALNTKWGNMLASATWDYRFSKNLSSTLTGYYSKSDSDIGYDVKLSQYGMADDIISYIKDLGLKYDLSWFPHEKHHIRFGTQVKHKWYDFKGFQTGSSSNSRTEAGNEVALYAEDEMFLLSSLTLNAGVRYSFIATGSRSWHSVEPRAALKWRFATNYDIRASYTRMSQNEHLIASSYIDLPTNCWMPSSGDIHPVISDQVAGGIYMKPVQNLRLNLEGWYKTMDHLLSYKGTNSLFPPVANWEGNFSEGKGKSYGMEAEIGWDAENFTVTAYYTLSWTLRLFNDLYPGWFYDRNDNRHKITLLGTYRIGRFEFTANWTWHPGNRITLPSNILDDGTLLYESPFNSTLPIYHRLDLGINYKKTFRNNSHFTVNLSVYNAYNRKNAYFAYITQSSDGKAEGTAYSVIPIIPTLSLAYDF